MKPGAILINATGRGGLADEQGGGRCSAEIRHARRCRFGRAHRRTAGKRNLLTNTRLLNLIVTPHMA